MVFMLATIGEAINVKNLAIERLSRHLSMDWPHIGIVD